jgi:3-(methylthio)propionyl---CoA ligase
MVQQTPYDIDLERNPANFQPLTPMTLLERAAAVFPDQSAIIHGQRRYSYAEFYARARQLASALAKRGIKRGDTVSVVLANSPAMLEAHYGVPMSGAVLNTINTRLDAAVIGFILNHADAKVLIIDSEFSKVVKEALAIAKVKPLVIDFNDPEFSPTGEKLGAIDYEDFLKEGNPECWPAPCCLLLVPLSARQPCDGTGRARILRRGPGWRGYHHGAPRHGRR